MIMDEITYFSGKYIILLKRNGVKNDVQTIKRKNEFIRLQRKP